MMTTARVAHPYPRSLRVGWDSTTFVQQTRLRFVILSAAKDLLVDGEIPDSPLDISSFLLPTRGYNIANDQRGPAYL